MRYRLEGDRAVAYAEVQVSTFLYAPNELLIPFETRRFPEGLSLDLTYDLVGDRELRSWLRSLAAPLTLHSQLDALALCVRVHVTAELSGGDLTYFNLKWGPQKNTYTINDLAEHLQQVRDQDKVL